MSEIKRVAVLGSGTMGTGIAGVCANADCDVILMDIDKVSCEKAKTKLTEGRSPVIEDIKLLDNITVASFDELDKLHDRQWICEAIIENVDIKREMFGKVESIRSDDSIISTNTSGIPLRDIYTGMPERLQQDIAVTHFFNPVHLMKLVELVPGENTEPQVISNLADFLGNKLGKGVVYAKDTVNFIGNRIGCMWILCALHIAENAIINDGLTIEEVDVAMSEPMGIPATGIFGLVDLIGIDVMYNVGKNLEANLPETDFSRKFVTLPKNVQTMFENDQLGRKTGGGFYKLNRHDDGSKSMEVFDIVNHQWRPENRVTLSDNEQTFPDLFDSQSNIGKFTRDVMATTLCYTADLVPTIADDIVNVDRAMRWGFA